MCFFLHIILFSRPCNQNFDFYDPWGKGHGVPVYDNQGDVKRHVNLEKGEELHNSSKPDQSEEVSLIT